MANFHNLIISVSLRFAIIIPNNIAKFDKFNKSLAMV